MALAPSGIQGKFVYDLQAKSDDPSLRRYVRRRAYDPRTDTNLPTLPRSRVVYSFSDGQVYNVHRRGLVQAPSPPSVCASELDFPFTYPVSAREPPALFHALLEEQGWDDGTLFWFYVMIGRLFVPTGLMDMMEVSPCLLGKPGTGKSTILEIIRSFFPEHLIGDIYNTDRDCSVMIAPDVTNMSMTMREVTQLALSISGESGARTPVIMAGNFVPPCFMQHPQISRRLLIFPFNIPTPKPDALIARTIKQEKAVMSQLFAYALRCYYNVIDKGIVTASGLWCWDGIQELRASHELAMVNANPVYAFMINKYTAPVLDYHPLMGESDSSIVSDAIHDNQKIKITDFVCAFSTWAIARGFTPSMYMPITSVWCMQAFRATDYELQLIQDVIVHI